MPLHVAPVEILYTPKIVRKLFKEYFPLGDDMLNEAFLYNTKTYSYLMGGNTSLNAREADNEFLVNIHREKMFGGAKKVSLLMENVCRFNYRPVQGREK